MLYSQFTNRTQIYEERCIFKFHPPHAHKWVYGTHRPLGYAFIPAGAPTFWARMKTLRNKRFWAAPGSQCSSWWPATWSLSPSAPPPHTGSWTAGRRPCQSGPPGRTATHGTGGLHIRSESTHPGLREDKTDVQMRCSSATRQISGFPGEVGLMAKNQPRAPGPWGSTGQPFFWTLEKKRGSWDPPHWKKFLRRFAQRWTWCFNGFFLLMLFKKTNQNGQQRGFFFGKFWGPRIFFGSSRRSPKKKSTS